ncbi:MAG: tRNA pseudouridine(38-40) synthase TruA [Chloroflexi bacterium]|nr:tRNA pseudouridine(38-40) synthase TruA [Chloroflexota bacterium]
MRVRAIVAYDGTDYCGFQRQTEAPTVQQALEHALEQVTRETSTVLAAGRTDSGVHAEGQVIAFDTAWRHGLDDLQRALNAVLPQDIAVREVAEVPQSFHPRYSARSRSYRYSIYNSSVRDPISRRYSLHVARPLDLAAMRLAAATLVGEHDFAAFGQPPKGSVTIRRVERVEWSAELPWLFFTIEANAFLFRMVRSVVGTLLEVGLGRLHVDEFGGILASKDRSQAGPTAPPHGLCLMEVTY